MSLRERARSGERLIPRRSRRRRIAAAEGAEDERRRVERLLGYFSVNSITIFCKPFLLQHQIFLVLNFFMLSSFFDLLVLYQ